MDGGASVQEMMDRVAAQQQQAMVQQLFTTLTDKCFAKCITKPASQTDGNKVCVANCIDRYLEATKICTEAVAHHQVRTLPSDLLDFPQIDLDCFTLVQSADGDDVSDW